MSPLADLEKMIEEADSVMDRGSRFWHAVWTLATLVVMIVVLLIAVAGALTWSHLV